MADGSGVGHNSGAVNAEKLTSYVERVENLTAERADITSGIRDVMEAAAADGYDKRTIREVLKLRKLSAEERAERQVLLDLYSDALGVFS